MGKDAAKPTKTRGGKARGGAPVGKTKAPKVEPVRDRRKRAVKRKATEAERTSMMKGRWRSSAGNASCSTAVTGVAVRKRKAVADVEDKKRKKRRVALEDDEEEPPQLVPITEVKGANRGKKRRVALKDTEQKAPKRVAVRKRKAIANPEDTNRGKKRRVALKDTEPETPREVIVGKRKAVAAAKEAVGAKKKRRHLKDTKQEAPKKVSVKDLRAKFEAKYREYKKIGEGAFGCVFAGSRRRDNVPVAIKHVQKKNILYEAREDGGRKIPIEVAVMLRLQEHPSTSRGASAPVALLDWYEMAQELILVHERPVRCQTMQQHLRAKGGMIPEAEAKILFKQLVDAALDLQNKQVFHRDIHQANVLIQLDSDVPRIRFIDFGVSCFAKKEDSFHEYLGASVHAAPECRRQYRAGPFTVWQIGMLMYESLHKNAICWTKDFLKGLLKISRTLSPDCQEFLRRCLVKNPEKRATLVELRVHAWLH